MRIDAALAWAAQQLDTSESAAVDARVLLCHVLEQSQTYLYTWPERELSDAQQAQFAELVAKRQAGEPVAYLVGYRDFWTLRLAVSPATLIPRPETEVLVEAALEKLPEAPINALDLGTGTGAVALALASERSAWQLTAVDRVEDAVSLARQNVTNCSLSNAQVLLSDWFSAVGDQQFELIVSNPPYVEDDSPWLAQGDVRFEPASALTSGGDGLDDIRKIVQLAPDYLKPGGYLMLEHGYAQHAGVAALLRERGFGAIEAYRDQQGHERVTVAQWAKYD